MKKSFQTIINSKWCKACGICIALCPKSVLAADNQDKAVVVNQADCIGCQTCVLHCPDFAVDVKEAEV